MMNDKNQQAYSTVLLITSTQLLWQFSNTWRNSFLAANTQVSQAELDFSKQFPDFFTKTSASSSTCETRLKFNLNGLKSSTGTTNFKLSEVLHLAALRRFSS
jgi:hypothetical protein